MSGVLGRHFEKIADDLFACRRAACDCAGRRKPCTTCNAYQDGLIDMVDEVDEAAERLP